MSQKSVLILADGLPLMVNERSSNGITNLLRFLCKSDKYTNLFNTISLGFANRKFFCREARLVSRNQYSIIYSSSSLFFLKSVYWIDLITNCTKADVIYLNLPFCSKTFLQFLLLRLIYKNKVVFCTHSSFRSSRLSRLGPFKPVAIQVSRFLISGYHKIICDIAEKKDMIQHKICNSSNIDVVQNPCLLNISNLSSLKDRKPRISMISRCHERKNLDAAFSSYLNSNVFNRGFTLHYYGESNQYRKYLEKKYQAYLGKCIFLHSELKRNDDFNAVLQSTAIVALPSLYEGDSILALDAVYSGCVFLVTDTSLGSVPPSLDTVFITPLNQISEGIKKVVDYYISVDEDKYSDNVLQLSKDMHVRNENYIDNICTALNIVKL